MFVIPAVVVPMLLEASDGVIPVVAVEGVDSLVLRPPASEVEPDGVVTLPGCVVADPATVAVCSSGPLDVVVGGLSPVS